VITRNNQTTFVLAALQLDAGTGAGGVLTPALQFSGWCDIFRIGPRLTIIV
jgi:hypothetical protein